MPRSRSRIIAWGAAAVVLTISVIGGAFYQRFKRSVPVTYTDPQERFKYGSLGNEGIGLPTIVFQVLPEVCPDKIPGGYEKLGLIYEEGKSLPIGIAQRDMGMMRMGFNCGTCHVGTYREAKDAKPHLVLGMPPQRLDFIKLVQVMEDCVLDPRFTPDNVMAKIEARQAMPTVDAALFRYVVIPKIVQMTKVQAEKLSFLSRRPPIGPGREDAINFVRLELGLDPGKDDAIATVDYPSVWNQAARKNHYAQWDGATPSLHERNRTAASLTALGDLECLDEDELRWYDEWLLTLPVPAYPFDVDQQLAGKGEPIFQQHCADCHAPSGKRVGLTTPVGEVGTDPHRADMFTTELAAKVNTMRASRWEIKKFRRTGGYVDVLLDGIWARAPYLHNGSVPNLRELLEKPENRSKVFYRGYDVYDPKNVGFVSSGPDAEREGWKFDTAVRGNSNSGHLYGTDLAPEDKQALVEYIKLQDKNVKRP